LPCRSFKEKSGAPIVIGLKGALGMNCPKDSVTMLNISTSGIIKNAIIFLFIKSS
jgi:hypothetical protein